MLGELESFKRAEPKLREAVRVKDNMLDQVAVEVDSLKASFAKREEELVAEKLKAIQAFERLEQQLQQCDSVFRQQLASKSKQYEAVLLVVQQTKEQCAAAEARARESELKATEIHIEVASMKRNNAAKMEQIQALLLAGAA